MLFRSEAESYLRQSTEGSRRTPNIEPDPRSAPFDAALGDVLWLQGKLGEAEAWYRQSLKECRLYRWDGQESTALMEGNGRLSEVLVEASRPSEASDLLEPAVERVRLTFERPESLGEFLAVVGGARLGLSDLAGAEAALLEAYPLLPMRFPRSNKHKHLCASRLVTIYTARHAAEPGGGYDAKAAEWQAKLDALPAPEVVK